MTSDILSIADAVAELNAIEAELCRRQWLTDPVAWATEKLHDTIWSGQKKILKAVQQHRRVAAMTCHGVGKALALDTPLPTPTGWTTMRDVQVGDYLIDEEGRPTKVTAISPIEIRTCSRVVFRDGSSLIASDDHQWSVLDIKHRRRRVADWRNHWDDTWVKTTRELAVEATENGQPRWKIPTAQPLIGNQTWPLPIPPYTFGAWLGDGTQARAQITSHVDDAQFMLEAVGGWIVGKTNRHTETRPTTRIIQFSERAYADRPCKESGVKRIPQQALRCSSLERLELLRGLMDTDGYIVNKASGVAITICDKNLSDDIFELIVSLGWLARRTSKPAKLNGRVVGTSYTTNFTPNVNPFRLPRKADTWASNRITQDQISRNTQRTISAFEPVENQLVKCVVVDSSRHLFLAGRSMVPTHNSFDAGLVAGWWLDTHKPGEAFVVTTAPTAPQVKVILWKEIGRVHSRGALKGRVNQTEWKMSVNGKEETVALGRKPNDYSPTAFQGIHAPYVLIIVDEANGVRGPLWDALDSLIANDGSKILIIGNPDDPSGEFFEACKPNSGYHTIQISAFDSPNFTGEPMPQEILGQLIGPTYVEEKRKKWAPTWTWINNRCVMPEDGKLEDTHPFWQSKILGQFPVQSAAGSLIPLTWIQAAQERTLTPSLPSEFGLDVGASIDGDPSCLGWRRGPVFRVVYEERQPDTMLTTGKLLQHLANPIYSATLAKVDYIGVGRGVVDRAKEQNHPVHPISVGEAGTVTSCLLCHTEWDQALTPRESCPKCGSETTIKVFANLLSQLWWSVRGLFERGEIDIDATDEDLAAELLTIRWEPNSKGQTVVKYGDGPSPNRADSLLIAFAPVKVAPVEYFSW